MKNCLYRHYDEGGVLLYTGIANNFYRRMATHQRKSHWFDDIAAITIEHFSTRKAAIKAEIGAIKREKPIYNKLHSTTRKVQRVKVLDKDQVNKEETLKKNRLDKLRADYGKHFPRALMKRIKNKDG